MSIALDGNGNSVPPEKPRPAELTEAEKIVCLLYGCRASREGDIVDIQIPLSLWQRLRAEAIKPPE